MKLKPINRRGQLSLMDAPSVVLIVGLVFMVMATIALISEKYGDSLATANLGPNCGQNASGGSQGISYSACGTAYNVTADLQTEVANNTSIAGIVLTISLVGIVLTVLIGVFLTIRSRRI